MRIRAPGLVVPRHPDHPPDPRETLLRNVHVYVPVGIPFPGDTASTHALRIILGCIPQDMALSLACIVNRGLTAPTGEKEGARQQQLLSRLASQEDIERINWFMREKRGAPLYPFFRGQVLELVRWILLYCPDGPSDIDAGLKDANTKRAFFKAALIASEIWGQRVSEMSAVADGVLFGDKALAFSRASADGCALAPDLWRSLGRSHTLFGEYVPAEWPEFAGDFQRQSGMTVLDYQVSAAAIVASYMVKKGDTGLMALSKLAEHLVDSRAIETFMDLSASTREELARAIWGAEDVERAAAGSIPEMRTKPLREKPIVRINDSLGALVDPIYFSDALLVGPLFVAVRGMAQGDSNARFGGFGKAIETYVLDTLDSVLSHDRSVTGSLRRRVPIRDLEVDGLAEAGRVHFVFEIKSTFLKEVEIAPRDPDSYVRSLRSHYVFDPDPESDRPHKAVSQLARAVNALEADVAGSGTKGSVQPALVLPVMVVHDELLSAPLHGRFFAVEFRECLAPQEVLPSGQMRLSSGMRALGSDLHSSFHFE